MASPEQMREQIMMQARQRQMHMMAAARQQHQHQHQQQQQQQQRQQQQQQSQQLQPGQMQMQTHTQPQPAATGSTYDDLPITEPNDVSYINQSPSPLSPFLLACRNGPLPTLQSTIASNRTPTALHQGLTLALSAGNIEGARFLLANGAPVARQTPEQILYAPADRQIPLFELLSQHGWDPNTPGFYGAVLLPKVISNLPLLNWFLTHGADPNLGPQRDNRDRNGGPETDSCVALETAASRGSRQAVQMLLDAGAKIQNGAPLHYAAGACPPGANPGHDILSKEFDTSRIPVMEALVERGADVNRRMESRFMEAQYAVVHAIMAGAVERVRWLLSHGADPYARGGFGSAVEYANFTNGEMKRVVEEAVAAMGTKRTGS